MSEIRVDAEETTKIIVNTYKARGGKGNVYDLALRR